MARITRLRHRVELPHLFSCTRIKGARVADTANGTGRRVCPNDHDITENERNRVVGHNHVNSTVITKVGDRFSAGGVECAQMQPGGKDNARRHPVRAGPIRDPASRGTGTNNLVAPNFGARCRIERDHTVSRGHIHNPIDHNRRGLRVRSAFAFRLRVERIPPGLGQVRHVVGRKLVEWGIAGSRQVIAIHRPVAADRSARRVEPWCARLFGRAIATALRKRQRG